MIERSINLDPVVFDNEYVRRKYALDLGNLFIPSDAGDPRHDYVTQGRHISPKYSSCGDWWNFVPWSMGCVEDELINRDDPEIGFKWKSGVNISEVKNGATKWKYWVNYKSELFPKTGDLLLMGSGLEEHVCMVEVLNGTTLQSFDFGQFNSETRKKCSSKKSRVWKNGRLYSPNGNSRVIVGWIDITKIPLNRYAVSLDSFQF